MLHHIARMLLMKLGMFGRVSETPIEQRPCTMFVSLLHPVVSMTSCVRNSAVVQQTYSSTPGCLPHEV